MCLLFCSDGSIDIDSEHTVLTSNIPHHCTWPVSINNLLVEIHRETRVEEGVTAPCSAACLNRQHVLLNRTIHSH